MIACPIKRTCSNRCQSYLQFLVISAELRFPRTLPNISKRSSSPTGIGVYFSLSEIRKIPSLSERTYLAVTNI